MSSAPRVFLIAQPSLDRRGRTFNLQPLATFGSVIVLIPNGDAPSNDPRATLGVIAEKLRDNQYEPETDYLVWAGGDTLGAVMVGALVERYGAAKFNWLRFDKKRDPTTGEWDKRTGRYVSITVPLYEETDESQRIPA